jgi:hypothetical protein
MPARPHPAYLSAWRLLLEAHATVTELLEHELVAERSLPLSRYDVLRRSVTKSTTPAPPSRPARPTPTTPHPSSASNTLNNALDNDCAPANP